VASSWIVGCQGQSRREAIEILCEAPNRVDMSGSEPFAFLFYIGTNVTNEEIAQWYWHLGQDETVDYAQQLRDMAREEGISSCPFVELIEQHERRQRALDPPDVEVPVQPPGREAKSDSTGGP